MRVRDGFTALVILSSAVILFFAIHERRTVAALEDQLAQCVGVPGDG